MDRYPGKDSYKISKRLTALDLILNWEVPEDFNRGRQKRVFIMVKFLPSKELIKFSNT